MGVISHVDTHRAPVRHNPPAVTWRSVTLPLIDGPCGLVTQVSIHGAPHLPAPHTTSPTPCWALQTDTHSQTQHYSQTSSPHSRSILALNTKPYIQYKHNHIFKPSSGYLKCLKSYPKFVLRIINTCYRNPDSPFPNRTETAQISGAKQISFLYVLTSDQSDTSHWGPQDLLLQDLRAMGLCSSAAWHRSSYTELSKPGAIIFQQRTVRNWKPSPHVREHSLQRLVSHLPHTHTHTQIGISLISWSLPLILWMARSSALRRCFSYIRYITWCPKCLHT